MCLHDQLEFDCRLLLLVGRDLVRMVFASERPICLRYVRGAESRVLRDTQDLMGVEATRLLRCIFLNKHEDLVEPPD